MSARDDFPRVRDIASNRLHHSSGLYREDGHQIFAALDEIDRLRALVSTVWGSDCQECGNATPDSQVCDACGSDEFTVPLYWDPPKAVES